MRIAHPVFHLHDHRTAFALGLWRLVDPKIALASFVPFVTGAAIAHMQGALVDPLVAAGAFAAIFFVEVGKNAIDDLVRRPSDVEGLLDEPDLIAIAWVAMIAAGIIGAAVAAITDPRLLFLGLAGAIVAVIDSLPPFRLADRGFGEMAALVVYGPGIVIGSVLLFGGTITIDVVVTALSFGLIAANMALLDEVPAENADRLAGRRTLVVRLGRDRASTMFGLLFGLSFALPVIGFAAGGSALLLGILAAVIPADYAIWSLFGENAKPPNTAQTATLIAYATAGAGTVFMIWLIGVLR